MNQSEIDRIAEILATASPEQVGRGASEEEIRKAESELALAFPPSYRWFLARFGWGGAGDIEVLGVGEGVPAHLDLLHNMSAERYGGVSSVHGRLVPVLNDGYGNFYCLDVRDRDAGEYPVVFWSHERPEAEDLEVVATNFSSWLRDELEQQLSE